MTTEATIPHVLGEATLGELEQGLRGQLVRPEDDGYDEARAIWNGAHDQRPALIVRCAGVADVMRAVDFARSENLLVAVRGGGHSLPGFSTCDGGIVIDLSAMTAVRVDPARRTAVAEGGCTWADFDHETQAFGLAVTGGLVSTTGIAGFTLGGGIGWLMRKVGLTCDNLLAADVVTADGQLVHASEDENPELLWGLRGGGGNFGIATSLEFRLHPVGPMLLAGPIFFAGDRAEQVLRFYRDWTRELPDEMTTLVNLTTAPPAPFLPEAVHGKPIVAVIAVHAGDPEQGRALVQPLKDLGDPIADLIGVMPYTMMQSLLDALWTRGAHNYLRSAYVDELTDDGDRGDRRPPPGGALTALRDPLPPLRWRGGASPRGRRGVRRTVGAVRAQRDRPHAGRRRLRRKREVGARHRPGAGPRSAVPAPTSTSWATPATSGCATPTATRSTSGWSRSSVATTPRTCST